MAVHLEAAMGIISRLGAWIDTRFPEKISAEEVMKSLTAYSQLAGQMTSFEMRLDQIGRQIQAFTNGAQAFDRTLSEMKDELNKVKAVQVIQNRQRSAPVMPSGEPWKR